MVLLVVVVTLLGRIVWHHRRRDWEGVGGARGRGHWSRAGAAAREHGGWAWEG